MHYFLDFINTSKLLTFFYAASLLVVGYFIAHKLSILAEKALTKRFSRHHALLIKRSVFYLVFAIFFIGSLQHLGFKLSVLLGAAGVFTVAISFASQTAISNLISGVFLLFERPFKVGDIIEINQINGTVDSIDLLSTKIKTAQHTLIRVPNETMMKSSIKNLSYFSTRRVDLMIGVSYNCDLEQVKAIILNSVETCEQVLKNPPAQISIENFTSNAIQLSLLVWIKTGDASSIKNVLQDSIKQHFDQEGIKDCLHQDLIYSANGENTEAKTKNKTQTKNKEKQ